MNYYQGFAIRHCLPKFPTFKFAQYRRTLHYQYICKLGWVTSAKALLKTKSVKLNVTANYNCKKMAIFIAVCRGWMTTSISRLFPLNDLHTFWKDQIKMQSGFRWIFYLGYLLIFCARIKSKCNWVSVKYFVKGSFFVRFEWI